MKDFLVTLLLIVFAAPLLAQCKFEKDEKDEFTGQHVRESKIYSIVKKLSPSNYLHTKILQEGDEYKIALEYIGQAVLDEIVISPEDYLSFKLADGQVITMHPDKDYVADVNKQRTSIYTAGGVKGEIISVFPNYIATKEDIEALSQAEIEMVRITVSNGEKADFSVKSGVLRRFKEAAGCFLE